MEGLGKGILHFLMYGLGVALVALPVGLIRRHNIMKKRKEEGKDPNPMKTLKSESWICPHCKTKNSNLENKCFTCGKPREENSK